MSIQKSELKLLIVNDLGATIEDKLEAAKRTVHQLEGGAIALGQAAKLVPLQLCPKVDMLLEEGVIKDGMGVREVVSLVKKYVTKCGDYLAHLCECEKNKVVAQSGEVTGIQAAMTILKKAHDDEMAKLRAIADPPEPGNGDRSRPVGTHPGSSKLADRRAAAKAAKGDTISDELNDDVFAGLSPEEMERRLLEA